MATMRNLQHDISELEEVADEIQCLGDLETEFNELRDEIEMDSLRPAEYEAELAGDLEHQRTEAAREYIQTGDQSAIAVAAAATLREKRERLEVIRKAVNLQKQNVAAAVAKASEEHAALIRDEYAAIVAVMTNAAKQLHAAAVKEQEFRNRVDAGQWPIFSRNLAVVSWPSNLLDERNEDILSTIIQEAKAAGFAR